MAVKVSDGRCLEPRLPASGASDDRVAGAVSAGAGGGAGGVAMTERRVTGVLHKGAVDGAPCLVREVRFDGRSCHYRIGDETRADAGETVWIAEDEASSYRPFCHLILERLALGVRERTFRLHRLPETPPSRRLTRHAYRDGEPDTLVVLDSCLTSEGGVWVEVGVGCERGSRGWLPVATLPTGIDRYDAAEGQPDAR